MNPFSFFLYFAAASFLMAAAKLFTGLTFSWWLCLIPLGAYVVLVLATLFYFFVMTTNDSP